MKEKVKCVCLKWKKKEYLNCFLSCSVATGNTLSRTQSPTSMDSHEMQRKYHFRSITRSCTSTWLMYLEKGLTLLRTRSGDKISLTPLRWHLCKPEPKDKSSYEERLFFCTVLGALVKMSWSVVGGFGLTWGAQLLKAAAFSQICCKRVYCETFNLDMGQQVQSQHPDTSEESQVV